MMAMFRISLIVMAFIKFMYYIRVFKEWGRLVKLVSGVFTDIRDFTFFYLAFTLIFALIQ